MMQYGVVAVVTAVLVCAPLGHGQACFDGEHCFEGYYCDSGTFTCQPCINCADIKRRPPNLPMECVKSISHCGDCLDGLVPDRLGDLKCVPPTDVTSTTSSSASAEDGTTALIWIGAGIAIALLFCGAVAVMYRYISKQSWIRFNVDTNIGATLPSHVVASAPEFPPPYSPAEPPAEPIHKDEETSHPLIKPYQPPFPAVEAQDFQNVSVFNPPSYVRLNNGSRLDRKTYIDIPNDGDGDNSSPTNDDETTTPSAWVPNINNNGEGAALNAAHAQPRGSAENGPTAAAGAGDFSAALAIARNTDLIHPPSVTLRLQSINGNEDANGNEEGAYTHHSGAGGASTHTSRNGTGNVNVMNVNQIFNIIKPPV